MNVDENADESGPALGEVTQLLRQLTAQQPHALNELLTLLQGDMRRIAARERISAHAGATLSTTALVNETYLKLRQSQLPEFKSRGHFYAVITRAMRFVLTDYARARLTKKRGGKEAHEPIDEEDTDQSLALHAHWLVELNDALDRLQKRYPRLANMVALRYYAGLSDAEIGELLGVEQSTVRRDWLKARGWLYNQLHPDTPV